MPVDAPPEFRCSRCGGALGKSGPLCENCLSGKELGVIHESILLPGEYAKIAFRMVLAERERCLKIVRYAKLMHLSNLDADIGWQACADSIELTIQNSA